MENKKVAAVAGRWRIGVAAKKRVVMRKVARRRVVSLFFTPQKRGNDAPIRHPSAFS